MKKVNNIYNNINNLKLIMYMYDEVRKNTKNKRKVAKYDSFYSINIVNIKKIIESKSYIPSRYNIFLVKEPKARIIMSQNLTDKVINHLVAKSFLINVFDKTLINENTATRIGKGTHYALKLFKEGLNYYKNKYTKFYVLKLDISKYFYNIDHDIVKELIKKKIKDKDVLNIFNNIIDSTDSPYVNEEITKIKNKEINRINNLNISNYEKEIKIKEIKSLPFYEKGKGMPIGNMSSQIIATFYLDEIDKYIKYNLGIKRYVRYMDDLVLIHEDKNYLKRCLIEIEKLIKKYKLTINKKSKIYSSCEEIEFLGFRFICKSHIIMKITNKSKKRFKRKLNIDNYASYMGHLNYGVTDRLKCYSIYKMPNIFLYYYSYYINKKINDLYRFIYFYNGICL